MFRSFCFVLIFALTPLIARSEGRLPLFAEDGSERTGTWWVSKSGSASLSSLEGVASVLDSYDVRLRLSSHPYEYLQDVLFFDRAGVALLQEDMSALSDHSMSGLTLGVWDSGEGAQTRVDESFAKAEGLGFRKLHGVLTEGGALISGRHSDGRPYVLTDVGAVDRTAAFFRISREKAKTLVVREWGIEESDLVELAPWRGHLDLSIQPFPGGVILLHDPSLGAGLVLEALRDPRASEAEKAALNELLAQELDGGKDLHFQALLDQAAAKLVKEGFHVIRVPGRFSERQEGFRQSFERINFLNGTVMQGSDRRIFVLTNRAHGYPSLERAWAERIAREVSPAVAGRTKGWLGGGFKLEAADIHFFGRYSLVAGLDCIGVVSP